MIKDLVSTIIPVYNRANLLQEAINSVLAQTYRPIEIIIVDDGSTDDTVQIVDHLALQYPDIIKALHITNGGPGTAREAGRLIAIGEFIQYLDSDDLLLPNKFSLQVKALKEHPDCGVAYGKTRYYVYGDEPSNIAWKRTGENIKTMFPSFLTSRWWGTSTPLYKASLLQKAGPWLQLINEEDWEYDCRIASFHTKLKYCDEFLSEEREHKYQRLSRCGSSDSRKLKSRAQAHRLIYQHAINAEITVETPEMQHFSRALFLLSRQCGAAGLTEESQQLFTVARKASTSKRAKGIDFLVYKTLSNIIGWKAMGTISCWAHRLHQ